MLSDKSTDCPAGFAVSVRAFVAALVAAVGMPGAWCAADTGRAIPPGQEELLGQMLGRGATLPAGCRFTGGGVESTVVFARYECAGNSVVVELHDADDGPADALRTRQFAVVVRSGSASPELMDALAVLIREREAAFEWRQVSLLRKQVLGLRLHAAALAGIAAAIVLISLVIQYFVASRRKQPEADPRGSRDRVVFLAEIFRRRQRPRDVRVLAMLALIVIFLLLRGSFLTRLPVYVDESVHIGWARGSFDSTFIGEFAVGRWLPIRLMALFVLLPVEPLFAARLGSVAMGLAVMVGCILINRELFSSTEGLLAGAVYTLLPYALLYDRMALADVYLLAFATWAFYCAILAARREGPGSVIAMSLCTYAALLSKPTGGLVLVVPILVSLFVADPRERGANLRRVLPTLVGGAVLLAFLVWAGYGAGLLASQMAFGQLTGVLIPNLADARQWFVAMLTPPVALLAGVGGVVALVAGAFGARRECLLALLLIGSILPFALVSKTWYPSYLLFALVPISLLLARVATVSVRTATAGAAQRGRSIGYLVFVLLLTLATARLNVALLTRPQDAALPLIETTRYVSGGLSGYGLPELAAFLRLQAQAGPLNVVRFDLVQPPKDGLDVYLPASDEIRLYSIDHSDERAAAQIESLANERRTLFVSNPEAEESIGVSARSYLGRAREVWSQLRPGSLTRIEVLEILREG
jgi:hypothetical protein